MTRLRRFSPDVAKSLGYYVYLYLDPDTKEVFYVGKGRGNRAFEHLSDTSESEKVKPIRELKEAGKEPEIEILTHDLKTEAAPYIASTWSTGMRPSVPVRQPRTWFVSRSVPIKSITAASTL